MSEEEQIIDLRRMRWIATSLLVLMAIIFVVARLLQPGHVLLTFVAAFAEAAMVGALADWFAVTALFRRPLGLPIPHTAIIPNNKDKIGESFARFLETNFMTHSVLREEFAQIDFASATAGWLSNPENSRIVASKIVNAAPAFLRMIEDDDVGRFVRIGMRKSMKDVKLSSLLADVLSVLVAGKQHHVLFDHLVAILGTALEKSKPYLRKKMHEKSPDWMPRMIDEQYFKGLIEGTQGILNEMRQEDSEWRHRFQVAIEDLIEKLRHSPEYEDKLAALVTDGMAHPLFDTYVREVWQDIKERLYADAASDDSRLAARLDKAIRIFSNALLQDQATSVKFNDWARTLATNTIADRRDFIAGLIKRVIQKWNAQTLSRKFELYIGSDLQYIRINGTLVGGLVGVFLHGISLVI